MFAVYVKVWDVELLDWDRGEGEDAQVDGSSMGSPRIEHADFTHRSAGNEVLEPVINCGNPS